MMMCSMLMLFAGLGTGYVLCILAKKEKGNLKVLGFTLGISILALSLLSGVAEVYGKHCYMTGKKGMMCDKMMKCEMMGKMHR